MTSKEIVVALDLDECLVHTFDNDAGSGSAELMRDPRTLSMRDRFYVLDYYDDDTERQEHYVGIRRPYLDHFLKVVTDTADIVAVYTASQEGYAKPLVNALFTNRGIPPPQYVFTREDCMYLGSGELVKPLANLLRKDPTLKARTDLHHIIMLDDRAENFALNEENGLVITAYQPEPTIEDVQADDRHLLDALTRIKLRIKHLRRMAALKEASRQPVTTSWSWF